MICCATCSRLEPGAWNRRRLFRFRGPRYRWPCVVEQRPCRDWLRQARFRSMAAGSSTSATALSEGRPMIDLRGHGRAAGNSRCASSTASIAEPGRGCCPVYPVRLCRRCVRRGRGRTCKRKPADHQPAASFRLSRRSWGCPRLPLMLTVVGVFCGSWPVGAMRKSWQCCRDLPRYARPDGHFERASGASGCGTNFRAHSWLYALPR